MRLDEHALYAAIILTQAVQNIQLGTFHIHLQKLRRLETFGTNEIADSEHIDLDLRNRLKMGIESRSVKSKFLSVGRVYS